MTIHCLQITSITNPTHVKLSYRIVSYHCLHQLLPLSRTTQYMQLGPTW